jgi:NAD-dependent deacetylase
MNPLMDPRKVVVLSGAGISAESGLPTFRDSNGLWENHSWQEVASPGGWRENPALVLRFYNERRRRASEAQPNAAHLALARLQERHDVVVVTQNVDDLHERAGSKHVIHVHGELAYARSEADEQLRIRIGA